ncbi:hypothetical protein FIBSPDRAFT_943307 [Athelia psychrophila]|uniref:Citrate transporter-like domain-containing protein n=1 Tax=Athelia psychrophila TaxID=1759441 RepID=A0A166W946_9AGAM|nr:hypothetical protein FIBSPDRAFT_943307 [Fibularhizoctonia sp. CBS 109695]
MINRFSIVTLIIFILSIFFVIVPIGIPLPFTRHRFPLNLTTAPILAIAILWAAQCLGPSVIRTGIVGSDGIEPYNILILFFSLAYMAITLDVTGILEAAAHWVRNRGGSSGRRVFVYFYVMLSLISVVVGNDPVILTGTAFLTYYTKELQLEPTPWLISEFAAANTASMVLFLGNPTNVVICEGFGVNNVAFSAYTVFPFLACTVFCFAALFLQFRDDKHIKRVLSTKDQKDPAQFLLDPIGALIGTVHLVCCLIVILVVSFFNVDVWKISLPFAVAKFVFDLVWDSWRYRRGTLKTRGETLVEPMPAGIDDSESRQATLTSTPMPRGFAARYADFDSKFARHFYTLHTALPRLPFALVPFAFSQFILVEALAYQGWIDVFAEWLVRATGRRIYPTVWIVGVLGVILCNISGTNIGATILLTKVARAADLPSPTLRAAAIALAVASNIGAVSFTFSASLAGLLWRGIIESRDIHIRQRDFAYWNLLPITLMTGVGLAVVCAEMAVLF